MTSSLNVTELKRIFGAQWLPSTWNKSELAVRLEEVTNIHAILENSTFYLKIALQFVNCDAHFDVSFTALLYSGSPVSLIKCKFLSSELIFPFDNSNTEYHGVNA